MSRNKAYSSAIDCFSSFKLQINLLCFGNVLFGLLHAYQINVATVLYSFCFITNKALLIKSKHNKENSSIHRRSYGGLKR